MYEYSYDLTISLNTTIETAADLVEGGAMKELANLSQFTPKVSRLTLVADPHGLLLEEGILEGVRERGFEAIPFERSHCVPLCL